MEQSKQKRPRLIAGCSAESCNFRLILNSFFMLPLLSRWHFPLGHIGQRLDQYQSMETEVLEDHVRNLSTFWQILLNVTKELKHRSTFSSTLATFLHIHRAPHHGSRACVFRIGADFWVYTFPVCHIFAEDIFYELTNLTPEKGLKKAPDWGHPAAFSVVFMVCSWDLVPNMMAKTTATFISVVHWTCAAFFGIILKHYLR